MSGGRWMLCVKCHHPASEENMNMKGVCCICENKKWGLDMWEWIFVGAVLTIMIIGVVLG